MTFPEYTAPILEITFFETDDILTANSQNGYYLDSDNPDDIVLPIVGF